MDERNLRSRNRKVGLGVLASMLALAALTAAYAWFTIGFRRDVDKVQPDARTMGRDLVDVGALTLIAAGLGYGFYRWRMTKEPRTK